MLKIKKLLRWLPLVIIVLALALAIYFRLYQYLNFAYLEKYHAQLHAWTQRHYFLAVVVFMLIYIIAVAVSIPGATILTIASGFLFGIFWGTIYVIFSATLGAGLIFLAVRTALGDWIAQKAKGWVKKLEAGFKQNAFYYLLFLRLVPLFPFWVINIVPALLNVRLGVFLLATFLGIIPASFIYVTVGNGLSSLFSLGKTPELNIIFRPSILLPILGLAVLSLIPILYKKIKRKKIDA
jgi:uncharacterized membrane protein YdjX (TVP38/TMEM64 family)